MKTSDLYDIAEQDGISIDYINCPKSGSISIMTDDGECYIGLDERIDGDEPFEKVCLAHELGHCELGAFYNRYSRFDVISKHEYRADKWAAQHIIPYEDFIAACRQGYTEPWQLAEYFNVTEDFIYRTHEIYINMGYSFLEE